jgi:trehalose-6-phosphate synthase
MRKRSTSTSVAPTCCFVSSLHDGMNLVAKEFVAARDDERGVLILSQFTGAARELPEALIVSPYDADQCAAALHLALTMPRPSSATACA